MSVNTEYMLTSELRELESQLSKLVPAAMPAELIGRMGQSMEHHYDFYAEALDDADLEELEQELSKMADITMPDEMITRMASAMDRWHEELPMEEKLVPFGVDAEEQVAASSSSRKGMWSAAAAVALLGSLSAFFVPDFNNEQTAQVSDVIVNSANTLSVSAPRDAWVVPDSFSYKVINTTQKGIVMSDNKPHRCIYIEYLDTVKVMDDHGYEIEVERPGVEIMLLPVVTN